MKIKKGIPLIDQHDKNGFWGKFGGNFIPETLKKPVEDLTFLFEKLRNDKKFIRQRDYYFKNWVGAPTPFIKFLSFLSFSNKMLRSSTGFFKVSGIKFPPNLPPQKPFLSCWSIKGIPFLSFILKYD